MPATTTIKILVASLAMLGTILADEVDDALAKIAAYNDGISALTQNKNEVAAIELRKVAAMELTAPARLRVLTRIAEAEVRAGHNDDALALFTEPALANDSEASYWRAIALLNLDRAGEAEKILATITSQPTHPHWAESILTRTTLLLRIEAPEEALKILAPLIKSDKPPHSIQARLRAAEIRISQGQWDDVATLLKDFDSPDALPAAHLKYLQARLDLGTRNWGAALEKLESINQPETLETLPPSMRAGTSISLARALHHTGESERAAALLRTYIADNPQSTNLITAFETLADMGVFRTKTVDDRLTAWTESTIPNLAGTATYYLAQAQAFAIDEDTAAATLEKIRSNYKDHPIAERALLQLSEIYVSNGNKPDALAVLAALRTITKNPQLLARIEFIEARADFVAGEFKLAADKFLKASSSDESTAPVATFNSAIASLKAKDKVGFAEKIQSLSNLGADSGADSLELERALVSARSRSADAGDQLAKFISTYPDHPRRAEAHLALAYLQLNQDFPKVVSARKNIEAARLSPINLQLSEEADYISFWADVAENNNAAAIATGEKFVKSYPQSSRAPEILFKLGGIYFRDGSFPAAQIQFERLALDYPSSPRAEIALFTAGRAAMRTGTPASTENAVSIFSRVAELGGQFAISAKLQQALVRRMQLDEEGAIPILDNILKEKPTGELLFSTLITKGESLAILGEDDPSRLNAAITVFDTVARHSEVSTYWRNQALTRKGKALERSGDIDQALATYEKVIATKPVANSTAQPPEYEWFFKAGFAAIRIYEEKKNWKAAIHTADTLASTEGPEAQTARERAEKLETENHIWRD